MSDIVTKWIEALRSGEYAQTQNTLRRTNSGEDDGYCCLGVLCDISGVGRWTDNDEYLTESISNGAIQFAPPKVWDLIVNDVFLTQKDLTGMNDSLGRSFEEIADYIEGKIK